MHLLHEKNDGSCRANLTPNSDAFERIFNAFVRGSAERVVARSLHNACDWTMTLGNYFITTRRPSRRLIAIKIISRTRIHRALLTFLLGKRFTTLHVTVERF